MELLSTPFGISLFGATTATIIASILLVLIKVTRNVRDKKTFLSSDQAITLPFFIGLLAYWSLLIMLGILLLLLLNVVIAVISPTMLGSIVEVFILCLWGGSAVGLFYLLFLGSEPFFRV